ncbi:ABC transporter permease [Gulosibacter sp. ACHW.36C]|uniref:ABC transporter permease n=1 Tax=Gulosibacter sediminis TaxID=1729695 RepID=A0ABY4MWP2_9MICO|nr:ABC transporter permease [Gulosibacter sediminis]UQN14836.1 ABC transporter permease [Gulosibacter sediminis]
MTTTIARVRRDPILWFAVGVLTVLVLASVVGQIVPGLSDGTSTVGGRFEPPSLAHPLGTDGLGRSLLARLLEGIGTTFLMSAIAVLLTSALAVAFGIVAAYRGGWVREVVLRLGDVLYSFPAILLALLIAAAYGPGGPAAIASIVLVTLPLMTRMVGAAAAQVMRRDFVVSARISGVRAPVIMVRHLLTNVSGTVIVQATYALSVAILVEGGLSFLGYGVQLPASSLGLLVSEGNVYLLTAPWILLASGGTMVLAILAVNLLGDALRDRLEPRSAVDIS